MPRDYDLGGVPKELLTLGNPKTAKGEKLWYFTAILHLAPATLSGFEVCSHRSAGCTAACLNTAGRGGMGLDEKAIAAIHTWKFEPARRNGVAVAVQVSVEITFRLY